MKRIATFQFLLMTSSIISQNKFVTIKDTIIGKIECSYQQAIQLATLDTTTHFYLSFQNQKYSSIRDIKTIIFNGVDEQDLLKTDLLLAIKEFGSKDAVVWTREKYILSAQKDIISLADSETWGATLLNKSETESLLKWVSSFKLNISPQMRLKKLIEEEKKSKNKQTKKKIVKKKK